MHISICRYTCVHNLKVLSIKENKICWPNKEYINGHRCGRTKMTAKCKIIMNCSKKFIGIYKKMTAKQGILKRS